MKASEVSQVLKRAGHARELDDGAEIKFVDTPPMPADVDRERECGHSCTDAYTHYVPTKPWHLGPWLVWAEVEHFCLGGTRRTYHVMPAETERPNGGEIPPIVTSALRCYERPSQRVWDTSPDQAKEEIRGSWLVANSVGHSIMAGELDASWLPDGSHGHAGAMWLGDALPLAYERGVNPLPLLRRLFPRPEWGFSRTEVKVPFKGAWPSWGKGELIASWAVKGGWVYCRAPEGAAYDNGWF